MLLRNAKPPQAEEEAASLPSCLIKTTATGKITGSKHLISLRSGSELTADERVNLGHVFRQGCLINQRAHGTQH